MKDMVNKNIKHLSERIAALEKEIQLSHDVQANMEEIERMTRDLSLETMLQIDDYIQTNKLLK